MIKPHPFIKAIYRWSHEFSTWRRIGNVYLLGNGNRQRKNFFVE